MSFVLIFRHASGQLYASHCHNSYRLLAYCSFNYLTNGTVIGKYVFDIKYVSISSKTQIWNVSHSKKNSERYCHETSVAFMWSACCFV